MFLMPISDLPAPSDENSQAQVMHERKSELGEKMQDVDDSHLPKGEKEHITDHLQNESDAASTRIRQLNEKKSAEKKLGDQQIQRKRNEKDVLLKREKGQKFNIKA